MRRIAPISWLRSALNCGPWSTSREPEASVLHNAWVGYEKDWLPASRGSTEEETTAGWSALEARGLAVDGVVNAAGIELRQQLEDETDRLTALPWTLLGDAEAVRFAADFEPPCGQLLARVDITAGPNYQPAPRLKPRPR